MESASRSFRSTLSCKARSSSYQAHLAHAHSSLIAHTSIKSQPGKQAQLLAHRQWHFRRRSVIGAAQVILAAAGEASLRVIDEADTVRLQVVILDDHAFVLNILLDLLLVYEGGQFRGRQLLPATRQAGKDVLGQRQARIVIAIYFVDRVDSVESG